MSIRSHWAGGILKPGFNPLAATNTVYALGLYSWGIGTAGQLGLGIPANKSSPNQIGSLTNWLQVSCGGYFALAIKTDGTLWGWGYNGNGQLGLGNNVTNYSSPVQVGGLTSWLQVSAGRYSVAAIKTDGTLWAWGANGSGQLGLNNGSQYSVPKQVGTLTNWKSVYSGYNHTAAIKTDGTLWLWGNNYYGQLGLNSSGQYAYYSSPKQVGALTNWSSVCAGFYNTAAIKTDGTLWTWGENNYGHLGLNNMNNYSSPKQVGLLTNWKNIVINQSHAVAVKTDGSLWVWGGNNAGDLGLNNTTSYSSPMQVGLLRNWSQVSIGIAQNGTLAIKTDGTLWAWGQGTFGQLGLGTTTYYSSPKQVGSLTNWRTVSTNYYATIAGQY